MDQDKRQQKAYPIAESLIKLYLKRNEDLITEGDNFDLQDWIKYKELCKNKLKMCVFGYAGITPQQKIEINTETTADQNCWLEPLDLPEKIRIAQEMIDRSKKIRAVVDEINDSNYIKKIPNALH